MITIANYKQKVTPEMVKDFPKELVSGHEFLMQGVEFYEQDEEIKEIIDIHLEVVNVFLSQETPSEIRKKKQKKATKSKAPKVKRTKPAKTKSREVHYSFHPDKDFYFIKRFFNLLKGPRSRHQIGLYIKALQRVIVGKEIRKTSKYANHITNIQERLCKQFNKMKEGDLVTLDIESHWKEELSAIVNRERVYRSVMLIKRYIGLEGKRAPEKVALLLKAIENAIKKEEVTKGDPYYDMISKIRENLKRSENTTVKIEKAELSGLRGIVEEFDEDQLNGCLCDGPVNSVDFARVKFKTLGFTGKWKKFIGDPTPGFTALVYGKPKSGKSTLCIQFARYLATLGRVLYVSKEEGKNGILQERMIRVKATHPNLDIDDHIPYDKLKEYDYLILDSVHKLGLDETTLDQLPKKYPHLKGHVFIMHSTKAGNFRGSQTYAHNVDVLINVDEGGVASQTGRFAQGSEMDVFN